MTTNLIFLIGVSGCGKSTIGQLISQKTEIPFFDADDFHPPANIKKMETGLPLDDIDRLGWLDAINKLGQEQIAKKEGAVIACSALKEKYRKRLKKGLSGPINWVYLQGEFDTIYNRMKQRENHYMPASLLQSQFDTLEPPEYGIRVDIKQSANEIANQIINELNL